MQINPKTNSSFFVSTYATGSRKLCFLTVATEERTRSCRKKTFNIQPNRVTKQPHRAAHLTGRQTTIDCATTHVHTNKKTSQPILSYYTNRNWTSRIPLPPKEKKKQKEAKTHKIIAQPKRRGIPIRSQFICRRLSNRRLLVRPLLKFLSSIIWLSTQIRNFQHCTTLFTVQRLAKDSHARATVL